MVIRQTRLSHVRTARRSQGDLRARSRPGGRAGWRHGCGAPPCQPGSSVKLVWHTYTCILLLEGVSPKPVAMQMGWSSVAFMLENYARFLPGWGDTGAVDKALGKGAIENIGE